MKKNKGNKGISLIILVITIIVIIILAGAVILSLVQNSPITNTQNAKLANDIGSVQSAYDIWISQKMTNTADSIRGAGVVSTTSGTPQDISFVSNTKNTTLSITAPTLQDLGVGTGSISSVIVNGNKVIAVQEGTGDASKYYKVDNGNTTAITSTDYATLQSVWDGSSNATLNVGTGTSASDPYIITTGEQLAYIAQQVNSGASTYAGSYFKLGNNIYLGDMVSWTPIGISSTYSFQGIFDGDNKTISGLYFNSGNYQYAGLFGYISNSTIKNVRLENSYLINTYSPALSITGGIVGRLQVGLVDNCYNSAKVQPAMPGTTNSTCGAGVVGLIGISGSTVSNCINDGYIYSSSTNPIIGGVIGSNQGGTTTNCTNNGTVEAYYNNTFTSATLAGVVSYNGSSSAGSTSLVSNCTNNGTIKYFSDSTAATSGYSYVGGIVGYNVPSGAAAIVTGCNNYGTAYNKLTKGSVVASGVCAITATITANGVAKVEYCNNYGIVNGIGGDNLCYTAGIASAQGTSSITTELVAVSYCSNYGNVTGNSTSVYYATGGILARCESSIVSYCYNSGALTTIDTTGEMNFGGIGARMIGDSLIKYCYNKGTMTPGASPSRYVGGVIGRNYSSATHLKNYYLSSVYTGGINGADVVGSAEATTTDLLTFADFSTWIATK